MPKKVFSNNSKMNNRPHIYPTNPYDYKPHDYKNLPIVPPSPRHGNQRAIEYQDDSLSPIESDDDENYLQKDKHGKISNFFRPPSNKTNTPSVTIETPQKPETPQKTSEPDDTKERLTRLELMLEKLINRETESAKKDKVEEKPDRIEPEIECNLEPKNHHFTTSMWLNKIQEMALSKSFNEKQTIQLMEHHMTGLVKSWYKTLPQKYDFTWPELKLLVVKIFPDNYDFITTLKRLVTRIRQSNESMQTYFYSKMYLIEACKIAGGEDAVSCLIDGLNNQQIQIEAKQQNYLTPETLFSQYLMTLPDYSVDYAPIEVETTEWYTDAVPEQAVIAQQPFEVGTNVVSANFEYPNNINIVTPFEQPILTDPIDVVQLQQQFLEQHDRAPVHARLGTHRLKRRRRMHNRQLVNKAF